MERSSIEIRGARVGEISRVISCVVAAFISDPVTRFAWPSAHEYLRSAPRAFRTFGGRSFEHGTAYVSDDLCGAALWLPPGVHPNHETLEKLFRHTVDPDHLDDLLETFAQMEQWPPSEPFWYLPVIGVEPNARGRGIGEALMRHVVARLDEERALAYLESSNPRNIPLYERHGFEILGEIQVGGGPVVTPMSRSAR